LLSPERIQVLDRAASSHDRPLFRPDISSSGFWLPALAAVGLEGVHIHDLRHTGNQFTANAGANPRDLMARMGHDSPRAALIYMHSSDRRQRTLADAVAKAARAELAKSKKGKAAKPSGTRVARRQGDTSENESR
jgi:integrase